MKRWLPILALIALSCVLPSLTVDSPPTQVPLSEPGGNSATPTPTLIVQPTFTPTPELTPTPSTDELHPLLLEESIHIYPVDLFVQDFYSLDVVPQIPVNFTHTLTLTVNFPDGSSQQRLVEPTGLDGKHRARFIWANQVPSDTSPFRLTFTLELDEVQALLPYEAAKVSVTIPVTALPDTNLSQPEPDASWAITQTTGFRVHYITGTLAERDLDYILTEAQLAYSSITQFFGEYSKTVDIYILDRVVGQGGYASSDWVAISYPDRTYSPIDIGSLLRHELTHRLDAAIDCDHAPALLREGLAVFLAGGHYREEPLISKASVVLANGYMIPISNLLSDFYVYQHEVAYLEAAAFVAYIEEEYGWEGIETVCKSASKAQGTDQDKMNAAIKAVADINYDSFVRQYRAWLNAQPLSVSDLELFEYELQLMDLMRAYQLTYDPVAHFLEGILFDPQEGERLDIVADFVRSPRSEKAVAIELLLAAGQDAILRQDTKFLSTLIEILESVLLDDNDDTPVFQEIIDIIRYVRAVGLEPYYLTFRGESQYEVAVLSLTNWPQRMVINMDWSGYRWFLSGARYQD